MTEQELDAFLAKVRHTRLVDYLDPLGETAQNAFERRLSWARVTQHDPAYADEARFLLDNADELRDVLRDELVEDDWVEDATAGSEFGAGGPVARRNLLTERERVTTVFGTDDLSEDDVENTRTHIARAARFAYDPDDEPTTIGEPRPTFSGDEETLVSFDEDPDDVLTAVGPASPPAMGPGSFPELDEDDVDPFDAPTTVGPPAASRVAPPPEPAAEETSAYIEIDVLDEAAAEETIPPVGPVEGRGPEPRDRPASTVSFEETAAVVIPPSSQPTGPMVEFEETGDSSSVPSVGGPPPIIPPRLREAARNTPPPAPGRRVMLDGSPAPLPGRPSLRRAADPSTSSRGLWIGLAVALLGFGFVAVAGAGVLFYVLSEPTESLTIERVEPDDVASVDEPVPELAEAEPEPDDVEAPAPVAVRPEPEPIRAPDPPEPEPEPAPVPPPAPTRPAPPPERPASLPSADLARLDDNDGVAAASEPPEPAPVPTTPAPPEPEPEVTAEAPPPAPSPEPERAAAAPPEPEGFVGSASALDVTGRWIGAGDGKNFILTISSQDGPAFEGTVELEVGDGGVIQQGVQGALDGEAIRFSGDGLSFRGTVSAKRAKGTYTTPTGDGEKAWTLIR